MQGAGVSIPDGVTSLRLYRAAGAWMRDELSYFVREEEREACDHLISAEYLPGRLFEEMARSLGVWDTVDRVARQYGYSAKQIADREKEMSLGSGTPGKCAVQILKKGWRGAPVGGYGICYTKGWFRQRIVDGEQVELQERWLEDHPLIESNQKEAVEACAMEFEKWSPSDSNFSNKLEKGTLRYLQAKQLAEILGYEIVWKKRRDD